MKRKNTVDMVSFVVSFSFLIFFVIGLLLLAILGIDYYHKINEHVDESYHMRNSLLYITNKVRQNDVEGGVFVQQMNGTQVLVFAETIDDREYQTRIYYYDGAIHEVFCAAENSFDPESGQRIADVPSFDISIAANNLLMIQVGKHQGVNINLWCGV